MSAATVYVVDDDPSVRKAVRRLLVAEGYRVHAFETAELPIAAGESLESLEQRMHAAEHALLVGVLTGIVVVMVIAFQSIACGVMEIIVAIRERKLLEREAELARREAELAAAAAADGEPSGAEPNDGATAPDPESDDGGSD